MSVIRETSVPTRTWRRWSAPTESEGDADDAKDAGQRPTSTSVIAREGRGSAFVGAYAAAVAQGVELPESSDDRDALRRYPESVMPIAGGHGERYDSFDALREELLLDYGYNTARAYWGDLDDWFRWADKRGKDVLALSERDVKQYMALLRRRKYSESTIRRRLTSVRLLQQRQMSATPGRNRQSREKHTE